MNSATAPRQIYIARHGHREDYLGDAWRKTASRPHDPGLSDLGHRQARELAERLRAANLQHIFASPFLRTVQTAHAVAEVAGCDLKIEHGICEWLNPAWFSQAPDFLPPHQLARTYPRIDTSYQSRGRRTWPEVDEKTDAWPKVHAVTQALLRDFPGNILFVGHGSSVCGMAFSIAGKSVSLNLEMCCLIHFTSTPANGYDLLLNGCTKHLSATSPDALRMH